mgnify:CR=1 FL=1
MPLHVNKTLDASILFRVNFPFAEIDLLELSDKIQECNQILQLKRIRFLQRLKDNIPNIKINGTLENFDLLDFTRFIAELKKQKIKLTLADQDEWEEYFTQRRRECNDLSEKINKINTEINQIIYHLYNLTEEEIQVVNNC